MAGPPYAIYIRGPKNHIFELSDQLGFESDLIANAVSIFEDDPDTETFNLQALFDTQKDADACLAALNIPNVVEAFVTQLPDEDWVSLSQQGLPPVEAGRFWVYGAHDKDKMPAGTPWPIHIEAGPAFGTGHHGTTRGCLLIFDDLLKAEETFDKILDLGCGAGTLAIAAALALNQTVQASDIDPDAVDVTLENARQNNVGNLITAFQADGFDSSELKGQQFDLVFANILAGPLMGLAPEIVNALKPGGKTILSGILDELADKVADVFANEGCAITKGPSLSGWTSLLGTRI